MQNRLDEIVIVGGGGHGKVLIDLISNAGEYVAIGIIDRNLKVGDEVSGISILGNDDFLPELFKKGVRNACIGIGSVKDNTAREKIFAITKQLGFKIPPLIHNKAIVSEGAKISDGAQVMAGAIIQTKSSIGENSIINTGAVVEHDCFIGKHVHVCPGAVISGGTRIGDHSFIGAGATVIQGLTIGERSIVGAGATVIRNIPNGITVIGVPAK